MTTSNYAPQTIDGQMCIWLQSYGWAPAKPAQELTPGDTIIYNFGSTGTVVSIDRETKCKVFITVLSSAKNWATSYKKTRLVACKAPGSTPLQAITAQMHEIERTNQAYNIATNYGKNPEGSCITEDEVNVMLQEWDVLKAQRQALKNTPVNYADTKSA